MFPELLTPEEEIADKKRIIVEALKEKIHNLLSKTDYVHTSEFITEEERQGIILLRQGQYYQYTQEVSYINSLQTLQPLIDYLRYTLVQTLNN